MVHEMTLDQQRKSVLRAIGEMQAQRTDFLQAARGFADNPCPETDERLNEARAEMLHSVANQREAARRFYAKSEVSHDTV